MSGKARDSAAELFAAEMKAQRAQRRWTQADLAAQVHFSTSTIANVESCYAPPSEGLATALDDVLGLPGTFARLQQRIGNSAFSMPFGQFASHEKTATTLFVFGHSLLPGLLQPEDYARAVLSQYPAVTDGEIERRVAARLARRQVLTRDEPPMVYFLIDEHALYREVGGPGVMRAAMEYIADTTRLPTVTLQVVPRAGAHPGLEGAFDIAEQDGSPTVVNCEDIANGRVTDSPAVVSEVMMKYRYLAARAYPVGASAEIITKATGQWN